MSSLPDTAAEREVEVERKRREIDAGEKRELEELERGKSQIVTRARAQRDGLAARADAKDLDLERRLFGAAGVALAPLARAFVEEPTRATGDAIAVAFAEIDQRSKLELGRPLDVRTITVAFCQAAIERKPEAVNAFGTDRFWSSIFTDGMPERHSALRLALDGGERGQVFEALLPLERRVAKAGHDTIGPVDPRLAARFELMAGPRPAAAVAAFDREQQRVHDREFFESYKPPPGTRPMV